jgi:hypothetical protein
MRFKVNFKNKETLSTYCPEASLLTAHKENLMRLLLAGLLFTGCFFGDRLLGEVDPESIPETPTYTEHIRPIVEYYCVACHYPGNKLRLLQKEEGPSVQQDALTEEEDSSFILNSGEEPDLSTYEAVVEAFEEVAEEIFEAQSMPPGASRRLTPREETILARWAAKGFPR